MERQIRLKDGGVARCNTETAVEVGPLDDGRMLYRTRRNRYFTHVPGTDQTTIEEYTGKVDSNIHDAGMNLDDYGKKRVPVRLEPYIYSMLVAISSETNRSVNDIIKDAILEYADRYGDAK